MANEKQLEEVVSPKVPEQFKKLHEDLVKSKELLVDSILAAEKFDAVLSKTTSFKGLNDAQEKANKQRQQTAILEERAKLATVKRAEAEQKQADAKLLADEKLRQSTLKTAEIEERAANRKAAAEQKAINKENERIASLAKKGKTIISNSQEEIDAYNNTVDGSKKVDTALNATNLAQARAASSAAALTASTENAVEAQDDMSVSTLRVAPAAIAAQRAIRSLEIQLAAYQAIAENATDVDIISEFNQRAEQTQEEITRLRNVGRRGFDEFGNAIQRSSNGVSGIWQGLRTVANILPGIGIAGVIAFAVGPLIDYIKNLEIIKGTAKEVASETAFSSSEYKDAVGEVTKLSVAVSEYHQGIISGTQLIKTYNEGIGKTAGELKNVTEVEAFSNSKTEAYVKAMFLRAQANAALQTAIEAVGKAEERASSRNTFLDYVKATGVAINNILTFRWVDIKGPAAEFKDALNIFKQRDVDELRKGADKAKKVFEELQTEADKYAKQQGFKAPDGKEKGKTDDFDLQKQRLERAKTLFKEQSENEKLSLDERLNALRDYNETSRTLLRAEAAKALSEEGITAKRALIINEKLNDDLIDSDKEYAAKSEQLFIDDLDVKDKARLKANQKELSDIKEQEAVKLSQLKEAYANGTITREQFEQLSLDIQHEYALKSIQAEIEQSKKLLEVLSLTDDQRAEAQKNLRDLEIKYTNELNDYKLKSGDDSAKKELDTAQKLLAAKKDIYDKEKELARELLSFTGSLITASFTNQLNEIQKQIDLNEKRKAQDIEDVNNSVASEEDKANKIAIINARAAAQQELLEQKQREIKVRQAKADKAAAIAGVILNIALANTKTLATTGFLGLPLLPVIAAIGAVQIATILSTPIPQFEKGGTMQKTGPAIYGEAGSELVIDPSGKLSLTPDKPTLGMVKAGTEFISNRDLVRMLSMPDPVVNVGGNNFDLTPLIQSHKNSTKELKQAIKGIKSNGTGPSKQGWFNSQKGMNSMDLYMKTNF